MSRISFSQKVFHLRAVFRDSNYLRIGISESMSKVNSNSDYSFSNDDSGCTIYTYYYNVSLQPGKTTSGQINVLFCKKESGYKVSVDLKMQEMLRTCLKKSGFLFLKFNLFKLSPLPQRVMD